MRPFLSFNPRPDRSRRGPEADALGRAFARHGLEVEIACRAPGPGAAGPDATWLPQPL